jgi:acyl-[acyl-carrier-protein] desaturase
LSTVTASTCAYSLAVEDPALLESLAPHAARLFDRHLATAREWMPHELIPEAGADNGGKGDAAGSAEPLPPGVPSALILNVLTEDNLPFYFAGLRDLFGTAPPWWDWIRRWTAEEMRHAWAIRSYLAVRRLVDLGDLERARMAHVAAAAVPGPPTLAQALVYLALQERATRIAHANTGRMLDDDGRRLMARIAADENLHHLFYRDLVGAALEVDPSAMVVAADEQIRHFAMPGQDIPDFDSHSRAVAEAGIYSAQIFLDDVVIPLVRGHWALERLDSLSPEATAARDRLDRFLDRLARITPRLSS